MCLLFYFFPSLFVAGVAVVVVVAGVFGDARNSPITEFLLMMLFLSKAIA